MQAYYPEFVEPVRTLGQRTFDFRQHIVVMAIVNRTPNSGLDPNRSMVLEETIETARRAVEQGAEWIDVGGRAYRPGQPLSTEDEIGRVVPVIRGIREITDAVISVDTHLPEVAEASYKVGADVVNDTNGLRAPGMVELVAETGMGAVITHSQSGPANPDVRVPYGDVVQDVRDYLEQRVSVAREAGIRADRLYIDPGHDLNKETPESMEVTRRLAEIASLGYPLVAACSNKDFIESSLQAERGSDAVRMGTITANTVCAYQGARIVRVHDVAANVAAMRTVEMLLF
ncbi:MULTISPECIES: dihydropteroate synthase [unclassified Nonomuraea]|uniref:dihydropteroate synthase n=1 Tax=unclassified Nonomuraea TaxID=2593643 RepID=UPI003403FECB